MRRSQKIVVTSVFGVLALSGGVACTPSGSGSVAPVPSAVSLTPSPSDPVTPSASAASPPSVSAQPTTTPTSTPTTPTPAKPQPPKGRFELPVAGSTGFVAVSTELRPSAGLPGGKLAAGDWFTIVKEEGDTWLVEHGKQGGRIAANRAMINLPDVIPSIVYTDVNSRASVFRSSGVALPGVTGKRLYETFGPNAKLGHDEYYMPVLYPMAARIMAAQREALSHDETLVLYQSFRPRDVQRKVSLALLKLDGSNKSVRAGIEGVGWNVSNYIALNLSNHQLGVAIDTTLGKVTDRSRTSGQEWSYTEVEADEYRMQTPIHELSAASATVARGSIHPRPTAATKRLRDYCRGAGLTTIPSEWWHFQDAKAKQQVAPGANGAYRLKLPPA